MRNLEEDDISTNDTPAKLLTLKKDMRFCSSQGLGRQWWIKLTYIILVICNKL